jgi:hypothetical protein
MSFMSTLAYAALTKKRENATPGKSTSDQAPGVSTWVDSLASLVPAEVLALHGVFITALTTTEMRNGKPVTTITDAGSLTAAFYALIGVSMLLYVGARLMARVWDRLDFARMAIPPLAFVGWTMLQKSTAFDAAFPNVPWGPRFVIAVIGAVVLGLIAALLAYKADQKPANERRKEI